jgi:hypothetical protein
VGVSGTDTAIESCEKQKLVKDDSTEVNAENVVKQFTDQGLE